MNQLIQFLINATGTLPEKWSGNECIDGDEDTTHFDFDNLKYDFVCGESVYDREGNFSDVPDAQKRVLLGFNSGRQQMFLAWQGLLCYQGFSKLQKHIDKLDWVVSFEFDSNKKPQVLKGAAPSIIAQSELSGREINQLVASLQLNIFLLFAHQTKNLRTQERIDAYQRH